jgi:hypothetical protein
MILSIIASFSNHAKNSAYFYHWISLATRHFRFKHDTNARIVMVIDNAA